MLLTRLVKFLLTLSFLLHYMSLDASQQFLLLNSLQHTKLRSTVKYRQLRYDRFRLVRLRHDQVDLESFFLRLLFVFRLSMLSLSYHHCHMLLIVLPQVSPLLRSPIFSSYYFSSSRSHFAKPCKNGFD